LVDSIGQAEGSQLFAMVDTLLNAALRIGEGEKFVAWLIGEVLPPLGVHAAWGNQFDRMRQRLEQAPRKVASANDFGLAVVESKLRIGGTVPTDAKYRV
jgi:hypothetical protein